MSEISSDLVFHFTKSFDTVMLILKNGFRPGIAVEDIEFMLPAHEGKILNGKKITEVGIPMVCFTDIPLELSSAHRKQYGSYGLGLSKNWAIRNGLNPVAYVVLKSNLWGAFNHLQYVATEVSREHLNNCIIDDKDNKLIDAFMEFAGYMKVYGEEERERTFYDEREWRYLPPFVDSPKSQRCNRLMSEDLDDEEKKRGLVAKMEKHYMLKFCIDDDLEKIIVPREANMSEIYHQLASVKSRDYKALCSKVHQV